MCRGWISAIERQASDIQTAQNAYGVQSFCCSAAAISPLVAKGLTRIDHHLHQVWGLTPHAAMSRLLHLTSKTTQEQIYISAEHKNFVSHSE